MELSDIFNWRKRMWAVANGPRVPERSMLWIQYNRLGIASNSWTDLQLLVKVTEKPSLTRQTIFPANLLTGAKHSAFSTNHLTDIDRTTTKNYTERPKQPQENKTTNKYTNKANETKAWFGAVYVIQPAHGFVLFYSFRGLHEALKQITNEWNDRRTLHKHSWRCQKITVRQVPMFSLINLLFL